MFFPLHSLNDNAEFFAFPIFYWKRIPMRKWNLVEVLQKRFCATQKQWNFIFHLKFDLAFWKYYSKIIPLAIKSQTYFWWNACGREGGLNSVFWNLNWNLCIRFIDGALSEVEFLICPCSKNFIILAKFFDLIKMRDPLIARI